MVSRRQGHRITRLPSVRPYLPNRCEASLACERCLRESGEGRCQWVPMSGKRKRIPKLSPTALSAVSCCAQPNWELFCIPFDPVLFHTFPGSTLVVLARCSMKLPTVLHSLGADRFGPRPLKDDNHSRHIHKKDTLRKSRILVLMALTVMRLWSIFVTDHAQLTPSVIMSSPTPRGVCGHRIFCHF